MESLEATLFALHSAVLYNINTTSTERMVGFLKSLLSPPSAAEKGGNLGNTPDPGKGLPPSALLLGATYEKP